MIEWAPFFGLVGLGCALVVYLRILKQPVGTERMREISEAIHDGAMEFLKREYVVLAVFVLLVTIALGIGIGRDSQVARSWGWP